MGYLFKGEFYKSISPSTFNIEKGVYVTIVLNIEKGLCHAFHSEENAKNQRWDEPYKILPYDSTTDTYSK